MLYIEGVQHDFQEGRRPHIRLSHPLMHRDALPQCFLEKEQIRMPAFSSAFMGRNRGSWGLYSGGGSHKQGDALPSAALSSQQGG